jgi:hypothetical protein
VRSSVRPTRSLLSPPLTLLLSWPFWMWQELPLAPGPRVLRSAELDSDVCATRLVFPASYTIVVPDLMTSAINLVNSSSTYSYDMRTQVYTQPSFAYQTLQRLLGVNGSILNAMQTSKDVEIERRSPIKAGTSLAELVRVGTQDQSVASTVLEAVLAELGSQEK